MKYLITIFLLLVIFSLHVNGEENEKYRRPSLYSILIQHTEKQFNKEIVEVFNSIPIPDKFDDHSLSKKVINGRVYKKKKKDEQLQVIQQFLTNNAIGRRLIAKWFNRDKDTGEFDLELITERGIYDASLLDIELAQHSVRGYAMLADAGEELIRNTFVLVNDIKYVDKEERANLVSGILGAVSTAGSLVGGDVGQLVSSTADLGSTISDQIAGFRVIVTSYLFRLEWTEEIAGTFYQEYYMDSLSLDEVKKNAFDNEKKLFTLTYIGSQTVDSGTTTMRGVNTKEDMITKVCIRAIDASIVRLQRNYDEFKVKTPLTQIEPLIAGIGVKEGVNEKSRYEVLERIQNEEGKTTYKRVGIIKPIKGKIWDNRYLATEEEFEGADLTATEFSKVSGGQFYPGMLIREIK